MNADLALPGKQLAMKGVVVQSLIGLVMIVITAITAPIALSSVAIGVFAFLAPHSIFAYWVFRYAGGTKNRLVAQSFNQGMKLKLISTVCIFVIAFLYINAHPLPLLGAYAITMVVQWMTMFCLSRMS